MAGALNSGRILIWNKSSATVTTTAVLDKIRNVQPGTSKIHFLELFKLFKSQILIIDFKTKGSSSLHCIALFQMRLRSPIKSLVKLDASD